MPVTDVSGLTRQFPRLFSPLRLKGVELPNRIVMPPMGTMLADSDGAPSDRTLEWYGTRARGGAGLIIVEITQVHPSSADPPMLCLHRDDLVAKWKKLADRIHAEGAKAAVQLHHPGRQMNYQGRKKPLAPSVVSCPLCQDTPSQMDTSVVKEMITAFAEGARRVREAGFDAVEVHGAHGYLIAQFMSGYANKRTDEYGGDLEGRLRFPMEILRAVREKVGPDFPIIFRYSGDERVWGGRDREESAAIAPYLVAAGADVLHISTGVYENLFTYLIAPMGVPFGLNLEAAAAVKRAVSVPVIAVGKLLHPDMAEKVLEQGLADLVAIGRGLICDPELPRKAKEGRLDEIRWCIACNQGCIDRLFGIGPPLNESGFGTVACLMNAAAGREKDMQVKPAPHKKKVMVVGGGPAGLEAARVARERGHDVVLYEKEEEPGGQFRLAAIPPGKQEIAQGIKYQVNAVKKAQVTLHLGTEATRDTISQEKPDVLIVATGGKPARPSIPGAQGPSVVTAHDVLAGRSSTGKRAVIVGGGMVGCETADFLSEYNRVITVLEMLPEVAGDMGPGPRHYLMKRLHERGVEIVTGAEVKRIGEHEVIYTRGGQEHRITGVDTVVLAVGVTPVADLAQQARGLVNEIYVIGDARQARKALDAIWEGAETALKV